MKLLFRFRDNQVLLFMNYKSNICNIVFKSYTQSLETYCVCLVSFSSYYYFFLQHVKLSAAILRNHKSNGLVLWHNDRSMYLGVHNDLEFCTVLDGLNLEGRDYYRIQWGAFSFFMEKFI